MIESLSFQTRARTIDHLGREQIADCPTAVSEIWKNSFDAYARNVALHIYDGEIPVASILDDGHGMSADEFINRWLVIGTESKATGIETEEEDRNGLLERVKQGQKGIGRLSCASLGSLCLIISKRKNHPFVASLIDWRLFENPYLILNDIRLPVVEFDSKDEVFSLLPGMFDCLMENVWGQSVKGSDAPELLKAYNGRIEAAWNAYDVQEKKEGRASTREAIESLIIDATILERHLNQWGVWKEESLCGTALVMADINFDLRAQLLTGAQAELDSASGQARDKLFGTLFNFIDPLVSKENDDDDDTGQENNEFQYSVTTWNGLIQRTIISTEKGFGFRESDLCEHIIEGAVDKLGVFKGRVKTFGEWLDGEVTILPKVDVPSRANTCVGPFLFRTATIERALSNSTLTEELFNHLRAQEKYAGFMVFRDGLRVMPYGREDNDFFEIEKRRGLNAGREFWTNRGTFGRVALSRKENPNLKDKAGREGIIDNQAAKVFRDIVEGILMQSARLYFGSASDIRKTQMPEIQKLKKDQKAEKERKKLRQKKRKAFRTNLRRLSPKLTIFLTEVEEISNTLGKMIEVPEESILLDLRADISEMRKQQRDFILGEAPGKLGALEDEYRKYSGNLRQVQKLLLQLNESISKLLEELKPKSPRDIAFSELNSNAAHLHSRVRKWAQEANALLRSEMERVKEIVEERNKAYHSVTLPFLADVEHGRISLTKALDELDKERERQDEENAELFEPYISALQSLQESIDLEGLASFGEEELSKLREELDRLNGLAQLGITVEIIGHEIEALDTTVTRGLREMPTKIKESDAYKSVLTAHETLTDRWRFLAPLKLSGEKTKEWVTGSRIVAYLDKFFGDVFEKNNVTIEVTDAFSQFRVYDQPARLLPVFINLINNSRYWVNQSKESEKKILLDVCDSKVIVADNGPGVDVEDVRSLFTLFFTRKARGGRGVGLYLCRANLAAGGHTISYVKDENLKALPGANFILEFKGAEYG